MGRLTLVDYRTGAIVEDMFIKPRFPVIDYLTSVSGITREHLEDTKLDASSAAGWIKEHIGSSTILIAHHAGMDFKAIGFRPHALVIDTAKLFQHPKHPLSQPSLEYLAKEFLQRDLHNERAVDLCHNSATDSLICCELVRLLVNKGTLSHIDLDNF